MKLTTIENRLAHIPAKKYPEVGRLVSHFLDVTATAMGRGSHYDSKEALLKATDEVHQAVFSLDRGIYGILLALPGVMDLSRQKGIQTLLGNPRDIQEWRQKSLLTLPQETQVITWLNNSLPVQRQLKLYGKMKKARINNTRTRRLILQTILGRPDLQWEAIKYRRKLATALRHTWGERLTGIIKSILGGSEILTGKEASILQKNIVSPAGNSNVEWSSNARGQVFECISFILGNDGSWTLPKLQAYEEAKEQGGFSAGSVLPPEVMEGIRSIYHPDRSNADVLDLTKRAATVGQRIAIQRTAKAKGVEIAFNPAQYDLVKLYVYAYEMGMDDEIRLAIQNKAVAKAAMLSMSFDHAGIVIDTSRSMAGHVTQKNRPIATALAIRDVLQAASQLSTVVYTDSEAGTNGSLPLPSGDTSLAEAFLAVADMDPDSIFVITDGYENAPAGRFAEVVDILKKMGSITPIYQLSPVMDAETYGTRNLSNDVPVLPINQQINIGMGFIKMVLERDFIRGIAALIDSTDILKLEAG